MTILFEKNNFPLSEGGGDFSDEYQLPSSADGIWFELDNGGNNGLWDGRSETTVVEFSLFMSFDDGVTYNKFRGGTVVGGTGCPIGRTGEPNCISSWGLVGLPAEQNGIARKVKLELYITAEVSAEKTIQVKNYKVFDDT